MLISILVAWLFHDGEGHVRAIATVNFHRFSAGYSRNQQEKLDNDNGIRDTYIQPTMMGMYQLC